MNSHDFRRLARQLRQGRVDKVAALLSGGRARRVERRWAGAGAPPAHWWDVPAVRRRWSRLVSGDPEVEPRRHLARRHLAGRSGLRALSLACGTGHRELAWARLGGFARIDAWDLSSPRIDHARRRAAAEGLDGVVRFEAGDVFALPVAAGAYDVVIAESALHHFTPLEDLLRRIEGWLAPDGLFFVDDFVGPTRMQWTDRQLEVVNGLLAVLPESYRVRRGAGPPKSRMIRPSRLSMILSDPSEAVESSRILPLLHEIFDVVELRPYGGAVLHLVLGEIAHHFLADTEPARRFLGLCFEAEDLLMAEGDLASDFVVVACRPRRGRAQSTTAGSRSTPTGA